MKAYKIKLVQNNVMLLYGMFKHPWKLTQDITVFLLISYQQVNKWDAKCLSMNP